MVDLYVGIDESNNGRAFEIHAAVFSVYPSDAYACQKKLPKIRSKEKYPSPKFRLRGRKHSFLLYTDSDKLRIPPRDKLGVITASLLHGELDDSPIDILTFFMDGEKNEDEISKVFEIVSNNWGKHTPNLQAIHGGQLDQRYLLVNIADHFAYTLFRRGLDYVSEHPERKQLIY